MCAMVLLDRLCAACRSGALDAVRQHAAELEHIDQVNFLGRTALYVACEGGHVPVVRFLVEHAGADVHRCANDGSTPLFAACFYGRLDAVCYLVEGAHADAHRATHRGTTPIAAACGNGHGATVRYLIERAQVDAQRADEEGFTPAFLAARGGYADIVAYLNDVVHVDCSRANDMGATPLFAACEEGWLETVRYLVDVVRVDPARATAVEGRTPFFIACRQGHIDIVRYLAEVVRVDTQQRSRDGWTPFQASFAKGSALPVALYLAQVTLVGVPSYKVLAVNYGMRMDSVICVLPVSTISTLDLSARGRVGTDERAALLQVLGDSRVTRVILDDGQPPITHPSLIWRGLTEQGWSESSHCDMPSAIQHIVVTLLVIARCTSHRMLQLNAPMRRWSTSLLYHLFRWLARLNYFE